MADLLRVLLRLTLFGSLLMGVLLLLRPLVGSRVSKGFSYYIWLVVLLRLCLPFGVSLQTPELWPGTAAEGEALIRTGANQIGSGLAQGSNGDAHSSQPDDPLELENAGALTAQEPPASLEAEGDAPAGLGAQPSIGWLLCQSATWVIVWALGALITIGWHVTGYLRFACLIRRSAHAPDEADLNFFEGMTNRGRVKLVASPFIQAPILMGLWRPVIAVPDTAYVKNGAADVLGDILRHELTHCLRRDILYKWFAMLVTSLHWFNPLMILLRREISRACELACDEAAIRSLSPQEKRQYGESLLSLAVEERHPLGILSTTMCQDKKQLKERLQAIVQHRSRGAGTIALSIVLALSLLGCGVVNGIERGDQGEMQTPQTVFTAQDAMDALEDSVVFTHEKQLTITIPEALLSSEFAVRITGEDPEGVPMEFSSDQNGDWKEAVLTDDGTIYQSEKVRHFLAAEDWGGYKSLVFHASVADVSVADIEIDLLALYRQTFDATVYESYGLEIPIATVLTDRLMVFMDPALLGDDCLISVYEKQSFEENMMDVGYPGNAGFIFAIDRCTRAQYEQLGSLDGGSHVFARDDTYYYVWKTPSDVQYYRSDSYAADWESWEKLNADCALVKKAFMERNGLMKHDEPAFPTYNFTYDGDHLYVVYYPYYMRQDAAQASGFHWRDVVYTLVLSQPAAKGAGGIWCVERYYDSNGVNLYHARPDQSDMTALDYYKAQQKAVDGGEDAFRLDPMAVALDFAQGYFEDPQATADSLRQIEGAPAIYLQGLFLQTFDSFGAIGIETHEGNGQASASQPLDTSDYHKRKDAPDVRNDLFYVVYLYLWVEAQAPEALLGDAVLCTSGSGNSSLTFYQQDNLLRVQVGEEAQWFRPAYDYEFMPYNRVRTLYEGYVTLA